MVTAFEPVPFSADRQQRFYLYQRKPISRQRNPLIVFLQDDASAGI